MNNLFPYESKIYIIGKNTNYNITLLYYLLLIIYKFSDKFEIIKTKYDFLIYLKNNRRIIYEDIKISDVIKNNRKNINKTNIKKPYIFLKLYINGNLINYDEKKLIFCHDDSNTLEEIFKAYHFEKIEKIIINNKEINKKVELRNLNIN
jgi:hypothetical protein